MDKNRGLALGVVAVLVVGAGSASVLDSFGSISGAADVEGPVFYADSGSDLILSPPEDASGNHQSLDSGGAEFVFSNSERWYPMTVDFEVRARFDEAQSDNNAKTEVILEFGGDQNSCESKFNVTYLEDTDGSPAYDVYDGEIDNCQIDNTPEGDLSLTVEDAEGEPGAYVLYDGDTNVEVNAQ